MDRVSEARNKLFHETLLAHGHTSPEALQTFRNAEVLLKRIKMYVGMTTLGSPAGQCTAGLHFVRTRMFEYVSARINDDGVHVDITFYVNCWEVEELIQVWWQNAFLFDNGVAFWPSTDVASSGDGRDDGHVDGHAYDAAGAASPAGSPGSQGTSPPTSPGGSMS